MTYGWNLEMQMRAARAGLRVIELPVPHRRRAGGVSKYRAIYRHGQGELVHPADVCANCARCAARDAGRLAGTEVTI